MSDNHSLPLDSNSEIFQKLISLEFKNLVANNTLAAGFKVRNKIGGPVMLVQGFIPTVPFNYSFLEDSLLSQNGSFGTYHPIYPKVQLNTERLTYFQAYSSRTHKRNPGRDANFPNYLFFKSTLDREIDEASNTIFVVCKYWSEKKEDFEKRIENIHELEVLQD